MQKIIEKAKNIKLLLLDVDGVLTNGVIAYDDEGSDVKGFHVHDGLGIKLLQNNNIETGLISAKHSEGVLKRAKELGMKHIYLGTEDKLSTYEKIKNEFGYADSNIAYMGDDLPDLPVLKRVGLSITVPQAPEIIRQHVDLVTQKKAGKGAVREVSELILNAQGLYDAIVESYIK